MKNRRKNSWLVILLMIVGLVVPLEVRAANVAKVSIDSSCENMEIAYGDQVSLDLLIEGAKERIRYSVNIYEGNSTKEADKLGGKTNELLCNQEKFWLELSFQSSDPLWSFTVGNVYTVEYRIQYWNGSGWEETKAATTSFKIIPNICKSKHSYQTPVSVYTEATCTEEGFGAYQCTMCGGRNKAVIPAKGHDYKEGVITRKPSCKQEGVRTFACKNCGAIKTETIAMLPHEYNEGIVIEHPTVNVPGLKDCICQVCDKAAEVEIPPIFSDVFTDWYTEAIQYVYDAGVMTGIKGTDLFGTFETVTKAQVAQVFYNMEENPEHSGKVFEELSDVADYEWYADAVGWAYDTGVVTGDTNTKEFSPNSEVTREQLSLIPLLFK